MFAPLCARANPLISALGLKTIMKAIGVDHPNSVAPIRRKFQFRYWHLLVFVVVGSGALYYFITLPGSVWAVGNASSYSALTGLEFKYNAVGYDNQPEIVVFCRTKSGNKAVPTFDYSIETTANSYKVLINGVEIPRIRDRLQVFINDRDGQPVKVQLSRKEVKRLFQTDHQGYKEFWEKHGQP